MTTEDDDDLSNILTNAQKTLKESNKEAAYSFLEKHLNKWKERPVKIAVTGPSGSGKSSFINRIRDLQDYDDGAAAVGTTETTKHPKSYTHPTNENVVFTDLPGCGTKMQPALSEKNSYFQRMKFDTFDAFLILSSERFTQIDHWIVDKLREMKKPYFFVRTKIDNDICNSKRSQNRDAEVTKTIVRNDIEKNLQANRDKDKNNIYLIDNFEAGKQDFPRLVTDIIASLPAIKAEAMIFTIKSFSVEIIDLKIAALKKRAYCIAVISGVCGATPIPGVSIIIDSAILVKEFENYRDQLDVSLLLNEEESKSFKEQISEYLHTLKDISGIIRTIQKSSTTFALKTLLSTTAKVTSKIAIPVIASAVGAGISFCTTLKFLRDRIELYGNSSKEFIKNCSDEQVDVITKKLCEIK